MQEPINVEIRVIKQVFLWFMPYQPSDPEILNTKIPWGKILIKLKRPYNENIKAGSLEILQIGDLIDNKYFQKIIKYKK